MCIIMWCSAFPSEVEWRQKGVSIKASCLYPFPLSKSCILFLYAQPTWCAGISRRGRPAAVLEGTRAASPRTSRRGPALSRSSQAFRSAPRSRPSRWRQTRTPGGSARHPRGLGDSPRGIRRMGRNSLSWSKNKKGGARFSVTKFTLP